jgi:ornithine decarboxylase
MFVARGGERFNSALAGPTCDSIDVLYENISLPFMEIGDLLMFDSMGAYTTASASNFNGFPKAKIIVID